MTEHLHNKSLRESSSKWNIPQHKKDIYAPYSQYHLKWRKLETILLTSGIRQGCPLLPLLFNAVLKVLAGAIEREKEIIGYR